MILYIAGKIAIAIQVILLLAWAYNLFGSVNTTDPAGEGIAFTLLIGFASYIVIAVFLLLTKKAWPMVGVLVMAIIPVSIFIVMWLKNIRQ